MRPPPASLPPPNSPKWHSRRVWDSLGYLRVRTLGNPDWNRDLPWLIRRLRLEMPAGDHPLRPLYDEAVAAANRYPTTRSGCHDADESWDELLGCVDNILVVHQNQHLDDVRAAGVSGEQVPARPSRESPRP
jgi:hypothetical protein